MRIVFCFSGKTHQGPIKESVEEYFKRIQKYAPAEIIESKDLQPQTREGRHIVLVPEGSTLTSEGFAKLLQRYQLSGTMNSSYGEAGGALQDCSWSMRTCHCLRKNCMVLQHNITVRVDMLFEELYGCLHHHPGRTVR